MGIRAKILTGFCILATMLLVAGSWSVYELTNIGNSVQKLLDENYKSIDAAKNMIEALEREDSGTLLLLSGKLDEGSLIIEEADRGFKKAYAVAQNNITIPGEKECIQEIDQHYQKYKHLWTKLIYGARNEGSLDWYFHSLHESFRATKNSTQKLMSMNDHAMYQTASYLKNRAHRATMPGFIAIISAFIFVLIFNFFMNHYLVSPLLKINKGIQEYLETEKLFQVPIETKDELFTLARNVENLAVQAKEKKTSP